MLLHQVLFYCHFPDLLLARRRSALHSLYRLPLDWGEQSSTGSADCILVNSKFTRGGDVCKHCHMPSCCELFAGGTRLSD